MNVPNERRGLLKALCGILEVDFTGWRNIQFAQFFLGESVNLAPSETAKSLALVLVVERAGTDSSEFQSSFHQSALNLKRFLGRSKGEAPRFKFSSDQLATLRSKFKGVSFEVLATIFTSKHAKDNFEKAIWTRLDYADLVAGLRTCDMLDYPELIAFLNSKNKSFVKEKRAEATPEGLAAVAAWERKRDAIVASRPAVRPRPQPRSVQPRSVQPQSVEPNGFPKRRAFSAITSAESPAAPVWAPEAPPVFDAPASTVQPMNGHLPKPKPKLNFVSIKKEHDYFLTPEEITAVMTFWQKTYRHALIFNDDSFTMVLRDNALVEGECSMIVKDDVVTEARMLSTEHHKLKDWMSKGCPSPSSNPSSN